MSNTALRAFVTLAIPACLLVVAFMLVQSGATLPPTLAGLRLYGPYAALALTALISVWFSRGRAFLALLSLAIAYLAYAAMLDSGLDFATARVIFTAVCLFVPFNMALFSLLSERGLFNVFGLRRLFVIAVEVAVVFWLLHQDAGWIMEWLTGPAFDPAWFPPSSVPQRLMVIMLLSVLISGVAALIDRAPVEAAMAGTVIAFALACHHVGRPAQFGFFISTGAFLLLIGVLQDSYRMAFRDELTGLPSRRALHERLMGLGDTFAIAMVDVDNFKQFNDTHGHDVGDQVLRMVASELERVQRRGRAYRYGGEEFTLIFPNRGIRHVMAELEALRQRIENHHVALRAPERPIEARAGRRQRAGQVAEKSVAVTISIGVAERNDELRTPEQVLKVADKALYRAKERGRNNVSR